METNPPLLPHFPPAVTLPPADTGYFGFENKASDLFEQLFFFHRSRSPGACGHPGPGHFPRELTRFPFSTEDRFSNSDWPLLASPAPGRAAGQGPEVRLLAVSQCLPCGLQGKAWVPLLCQNLPLPSPTSKPLHTHKPSTAAPTPNPLAIIHQETGK